MSIRYALLATLPLLLVEAPGLTLPTEFEPPIEFSTFGGKRIPIPGRKGDITISARVNGAPIAVIYERWPGARSALYDVGGLPEFLVKEGFAVAVVRPKGKFEGTVDRQLDALKTALVELTRRAPELGYDSERCILIGANVSAYAVARAALEDAAPTAQPQPAKTVNAVILLDGQWLDPDSSEEGPPLRSMLGQPNVQNFLVVGVKDSQSRRVETESFIAAVRSSGAAVVDMWVRRSLWNSDVSALGAKANADGARIVEYLRSAGLAPPVRTKP